ncbi:protein wntless homolog isoform X1 [Myripristis murdjan]|uniref:protein wntless homolog isoform X1 n=1 Tax=Myripristis murdjan TaxID=586833 RepID=UPI001175D4C5|nr:protein wntless homolog isoform X1 [Myripristis murdjan]
MAGAIIENMSTKKLVVLGLTVLIFQVLSVLVGGLIAPSPTSAIHYLATKCVRRHRGGGGGGGWLMPWGSSRCQRIRSFDDTLAKTLDANDIVFAVHVPLPNKEMSPWFQFMLVVLQFDIAFKMLNQIEDGATITIDAGLAYRDDVLSNWTTKFHSVEKRQLSCMLMVPKTFENEGRFYVCDPVPFIELGSVAHKYYLINLRLPVNDIVNTGIGEIKDIHLVGIHQNGGFTKVWISMKTAFSPWIFVTTAWYWRRISLMTRPPVLIEKMIFALGISMTFLNVPVEWLSLGFEWTWMLLFEDFQQGVFYATLFCFWIIFCGEHLMDQSQRNRLSAYWWQVGLVVFGSLLLLIFDLTERGGHLSNPFHSVWASPFGTKCAITFIIMAGISVCLYFLSLCCMVGCVFRNIGGKVQQLPAMSETRRLHYEGIIFRFKFLMLVTLACAAMTVIFFIITQVSEGHWHWGDYTLQVHSGFLTGIYGMWNLYVFTIIFLYAPSHKHKSNKTRDEQKADTLETPESQETQLTRFQHVPTETYRITGKVAEE